MICSTLTGKMAIKHPELGVLVREDGYALLKGRTGKENWTRGWKVNPSGYMRIRINGKQFYMHRLVMEAFVGECPVGMSVDHINRDRTDNRKRNLRFASAKEQSANSSKADKCVQKYGIRWVDDPKEYAIRYYSKRHEEIKTQQHNYYLEHRDDINAKRRLAYAAKRQGTI